MAQVKIYGVRDELNAIKNALSIIIQSCLIDALQIPPDKRFQRFFALEDDDFLFPDDRSARYTIIEISMFEGRSVAAKKQLVQLLMQRTQSELGLDANDLEITIFETPRENWGIRGQHGDEIGLNYSIVV